MSSSNINEDDDAYYYDEASSDCSATAYVSSNVTAGEDPKFCVHFETSTLGQRKQTIKHCWNLHGKSTTLFD